MSSLVFLLIGLPLLGFVVSLLIPARFENGMAAWVKFITTTLFFTALGVSVYWLVEGRHLFHYHGTTVLSSGHYIFYLEFYLDWLSLVYACFGSFLFMLIAFFSHRYLHRESGYKRFFNVFLFFCFGIVLILFAGNFETMFIGWEVIGLSSYLLIGYYRDRHLPVRNSLKIFSIYRLSDIAVILAMWMSHHLWGQNISFYELDTVKSFHSVLVNHSGEATVIALLLLTASAVKSGLFPFSSWIPRAMEGPTPSSAIFYGAVSVHIGAFLMIRTQSYWEDQLTLRWIIGGVGIITAILANMSARVQSTVKGHIGYASVSQIGLIFTEISLGWVEVAAVHIVANAFFRTYHLLISPSMVVYKMREQYYQFEPIPHTALESLSKRLNATFYLWSIREFNLDRWMFIYLWQPLKKMGSALGLVSIRGSFLFIGLLFIGAESLLQLKFMLPTWLSYAAPLFLGSVGLLLVLRSFSERRHPILAWILIICNQLFVWESVQFNQHISGLESGMFLSGVILAGTLGLIVLIRLKKLEGRIHLRQFSGLIHAHPKMAVLFLIAAIGLAGFPITPTFIGEDLLFSHIEENQIGLAAITSISFIIDGIALIRLYTRLFLGPTTDSLHGIKKSL